MLEYESLTKECILRLVLLRHGKPDDEAKGRCYGNLDFSLSDTGKKQIQEKVLFIGRFNATAIYMSPLRRAVESAAIAATCLQLQPIISPELREIHFGRFEGLTYQEIERQYPDDFRLWMAAPTEVKFPGGESFVEVQERVLRFIALLRNAHRHETVLLVSHGGINRIILAEALGLPDHLAFRLDQAFAAVDVIDYFERHRIVRLING